MGVTRGQVGRGPGGSQGGQGGLQGSNGENRVKGDYRWSQGSLLVLWVTGSLWGHRGHFGVTEVTGVTRGHRGHVGRGAQVDPRWWGRIECPLYRWWGTPDIHTYIASHRQSSII